MSTATTRGRFQHWAGAAAALGAFAISIGCAHAVSERVKNACSGDYYRHCSEHAVDSASLRVCMRKVGEGLSTPCLQALVQEGQITKADIDAHNAKSGQATKTVANAEQGDEAQGKTVKKGGAAAKTTKVAAIDKTPTVSGKPAPKATGNVAASQNGKATKTAKAASVAGGTVGKTAAKGANVKASDNGVTKAAAVKQGKQTKVASVGKAPVAMKTATGSSVASTGKAATATAGKGTGKAGKTTAAVTGKTAAKSAGTAADAKAGTDKNGAAKKSAKVANVKPATTGKSTKTKKPGGNDDGDTQEAKTP